MPSSSIINFLGEFSAESLISGLQHKKIHPSVLHHINLLLDEVLSALITKASSINPKDIRATGVPAVFSSGNAHESTGIKALARECVGEAEMELRAYHAHMVQGNARGFHPSQQGRGMTASKEAAEAKFPTAEAIQLLRMRLSDLSGTSKNAPNHQQQEELALEAWEQAGGDPSDLTVEVSGAWLHAFMEHLTNELLTQLGRVVERDSNSVLCGPGDLFTALAEDERYWGWFARLKVKDSLEQAMKAMSKPVKHINPPPGRLSSLDGSPNHSRVSLNGRDSSFESPGRRRPPTAETSATRGSSDTSRLASVTRKTSTMTKRFGVGHDRKDSVLSVNTKSPPEDRARSPIEDEEEFDALVRSGETMKVSLTPSRLKTFDARGGVQPAALPMPPSNDPHRETPPRASALRNPPPSASKLAPRAATTIDERTDEEDNVASAARPQKHSLKDLMASEPIDLATAPAGRRAVPAVILGAPPPGSALGVSPDSGRPDRAPSHVASPSQTSMSSSLYTPNAPSVNRNASSTGRDTLASRRVGTAQKSRSEAQELADFFNSTPPPPPAPTSQPTTATSTKSAKGFRGYLSKVTGGNKKREEEARLARENAAFEAVKIPDGPKKQQSMASFATVNTGTTTYAAPPSAFRGEDAPPVLPSQKLRKRSDTSGSSSDKGASPGEGITVHRTTSSTARHFPSTPRDPLERVGDVTSQFSAGKFSNRVAPAPAQLPRSVPDDESQETLSTSKAATSAQLASPYQGKPVSQAHEHRQNRSGVTEAGAAKQAANMVHLEPAINAVSAPGTRSAHADHTPSDANSFATAEEGTDGEVDMPIATPAATDRFDGAPESDGEPAQKTSSTSHADEPDPAAPSVLVSRLAPLRTILQHATSADECRMLVNAYCTQIGIPFDANAGHAEANAEAKVHAWLLDHEAGPPVAWPWSPPISRVEDSPTSPVIGHEHTNNAAIRDGRKNGISEDAEDLVSDGRNEDDDAASEASMSEEDAREEPSIARAATRTSPVRIAAAASLA